MNANLNFDFSVDKENRKIHIKREFLADRQLVWDCNTRPELLDQWFAPSPLTAKTKRHEFEEGGKRHYAMVEPNGTTHWSLTKYISIKPIEFFSSIDSFADEDGNINESLPTSYWESSFKDQQGNTLVEITATFNALEDLETIIKMGFREGMKSTMDRLDDLLLVILQTDPS
ncbi:MAG: SRPBCC domain-containing protein [Bacteroidia bacterium]